MTSLSSTRSSRSSRSCSRSSRMVAWASSKRPRPTKGSLSIFVDHDLSCGVGARHEANRCVCGTDIAEIILLLPPSNHRPTAFPLCHLVANHDLFTGKCLDRRAPCFRCCIVELVLKALGLERALIASALRRNFDNLHAPAVDGRGNVGEVIVSTRLGDVVIDRLFGI